MFAADGIGMDAILDYLLFPPALWWWRLSFASEFRVKMRHIRQMRQI